MESEGLLAAFGLLGTVSLEAQCYPCPFIGLSLNPS